MKNFVIALTLLCAGCGTLNKQYVAADRADYDIFNPLITRWLETEPGLAIDPDMRDVDDYIDILKLKLKIRGIRIETAERTLEAE